MAKEKSMKADNEKYLYKRWIFLTILPVLIIFCFIMLVNLYIDPYFHYHAPLSGWTYPLHTQLYINDGIMRHFEYNGIITGTSMVENFKTSEADELFDAEFVKVPFSGERYRLIDENIRTAYETGKSIDYVIRCLDYSMLVEDKDNYRPDLVYPTYLYNNSVVDDINYLLNKYTVYALLEVVRSTISGRGKTSFDEYSNWNAYFTFGAETVLSTYMLDDPVETQRLLTDEEYNMILGNIQQNVTDLADEHPETTFYLFFPPYSICYWDSLKNAAEIDWRIDAEQVAIEELLKHSNIRLYSFCNNFDMVCNLDNYKDRAHYGEWVNSWILEWMHEGEYLLTKDNYQEYLETIREFYNSYDYDSLRE